MTQSDDYDVGYGKPPKHTQFKPGQSGNPAGGKKPDKSLIDLFVDEGKKNIKVKQGNQQLTLSKRAALVKRVFASALEGNLKATQLIFTVLGQAQNEGLTGDAPDLTEEEIAVLAKAFMASQKGGAV